MNRHHSPRAGSSTPRSSALIVCLSQPMGDCDRKGRLSKSPVGGCIYRTKALQNSVFRLKMLHTYETAYTSKEKSNSRFCAHVGVDKLTRQLMGMEWAQSKYNREESATIPCKRPHKTGFKRKKGKECTRLAEPQVVSSEKHVPARRANVKKGPMLLAHHKQAQKEGEWPCGKCCEEWKDKQRMGRAVQTSQVGLKGLPINTHQQTASKGWWYDLYAINTQLFHFLWFRNVGSGTQVKKFENFWKDKTDQNTFILHVRDFSSGRDKTSNPRIYKMLTQTLISAACSENLPLTHQHRC